MLSPWSFLKVDDYAVPCVASESGSITLKLRIASGSRINATFRIHTSGNHLLISVKTHGTGGLLL